MNFKVARLTDDLRWFGAFQCPNEDFSPEKIKELLPGMIIDKAETFVQGGFVDIYFHFDTPADEALFILKAEALQQEQDKK